MPLRASKTLWILGLAGPIWWHQKGTQTQFGFYEFCQNVYESKIPSRINSSITEPLISHLEKDSDDSQSIRLSSRILETGVFSIPVHQVELWGRKINHAIQCYLTLSTASVRRRWRGLHHCRILASRRPQWQCSGSSMPARGGQYLAGELDAVDSVFRASFVTGSPVEVELLQTVRSRDWTPSQGCSSQDQNQTQRQYRAWLDLDSLFSVTIYVWILVLHLTVTNDPSA